MGKTSEIEWTDATWNPWYGCRKVSAGCKLCYAERDMTRYGRDFSRVTRAAPATFNAPLKWKDPLRIFTCSWSDFFIEQADPWRAEAWEIIRQTPQHTYMILTKRPERILHGAKIRLPWEYFSGDYSQNAWPNVRLGVSVEKIKDLDRIEALFRAPCKLYFCSYEPALEAVSFSGYFLAIRDDAKLGWLIIGGESARPRSKARPFHLEWAFDALAQCRAAGVACFIKQLGSNPYYRGQPLKLRDWKGSDMSEWPEGLRVREMPNAKVKV